MYNNSSGVVVLVYCFYCWYWCGDADEIVTFFSFSTTNYLLLSSVFSLTTPTKNDNNNIHGEENIRQVTPVP